jgi:hypothetical protein
MNVDKSSIIRARNKYTENALNDLNKKLTDLHYKLFNYNDNHMTNNIKNRILAADGSYLPLIKNEQTKNITKSPAGRYISGLMSCIYDVRENLPLSYSLENKRDERAALIKQLSFLKENDIIVLDRGYFSIHLVYTLSQHQIYVVCRLKENMSAIKYMIKNNVSSLIKPIQYLNNSINFKYIWYKIQKGNKTKNYFIGTTLINATINELQILYHKRWSIETHFFMSKYYLSLNHITSKLLLHIKQDIILHLFISIISSFFYSLVILFLEKNNKTKDDCIIINDNKYKINKKVLINVICHNILPLLVLELDDKYAVSEIIRILKIVQKYKIDIIDDRHYERFNIMPNRGWRSNKNYKNNAK